MSTHIIHSIAKVRRLFFVDFLNFSISTNTPRTGIKYLHALINIVHVPNIIDDCKMLEMHINNTHSFTIPVSLIAKLYIDLFITFIISRMIIRKLIIVHFPSFNIVVQYNFHGCSLKICFIFLLIIIILFVTFAPNIFCSFALNLEYPFCHDAV